MDDEVCPDLVDGGLVGEERLGDEVDGERRGEEGVGDEHQAGVLAAQRRVQRRRLAAVVVEEVDEALRHGEHVASPEHLGHDAAVRVRRDEAEVDGADEHHRRLRRPRVVVRREHAAGGHVDAGGRRAQRVQPRDVHRPRREPVPPARRRRRRRSRPPSTPPGPCTAARSPALRRSQIEHVLNPSSCIGMAGAMGDRTFGRRVGDAEVLERVGVKGDDDDDAMAGGESNKQQQQQQRSPNHGHGYSGDYLQ